MARTTRDELREMILPRARFVGIRPLATAAGVHASHLGAWLRGHGRLSDDAVLRVARASGITVQVMWRIVHLCPHPRLIDVRRKPLRMDLRGTR